MTVSNGGIWKLSLGRKEARKPRGMVPIFVRLGLPVLIPPLNRPLSVYPSDLRSQSTLSVFPV
eukprot:3589096-Karenia_brevis.AAC.1